MLSRLSGLANTVLQELSGDGEDGGAATTPTGPQLEPSQQNGEETPEDVLERLAHTERLVAQLKDLVREKDAQLQQKDALLQEEKQASEAKLLKLKLQAKAKLASLNKRIEELTEQGVASPASGLPGEPQPPTGVESDQGTSDKSEEETEGLRRKLQEQEKMVEELQEQLKAATGNLAEAQAQLSTLQEEIRQKDSLLEEQACQHQAELQRLATQSALEAEMQQNLRLLQRKLEEQEAALLGRTQVVELLQQELNGAEEQKQVLLEKCQKAEAELDSLRSSLASQREESQLLVERLELEVAEKKMASHCLQEEVQQPSQELACARADHERQSQAVEQRHVEEMAEKNQEITQLRTSEQDLRSRYEALQAKNARLQQERDWPPEGTTEGSPILQGESPEMLKESDRSQAESEALPAQVSEECCLSAGDPRGFVLPVAEQVAAVLPSRISGEPEEQEIKTVAEAAEAKMETLPATCDMLVKSPDFAASLADSNQVNGAERDAEEQPHLAPGVPSSFGGSLPDPGGLLEGPGSDHVEDSHPADSPAALPQAHVVRSPEDPLLATENGQPNILDYLSAKKRRDLSVLLLELQEAQEEIAFLKGQLQDSKHLDQDTAEEPRGQSQAHDDEERDGGRGEEVVPTQSDSSSSSLVTVDVQEEPPPLSGMLFGQDGLLPERGETAHELPPARALQLEIAELRARLQEEEERHKRTLEEKVEEVQRLQQQAEDSEVALRTLRMEKGELLTRLEELCSLAELKEQVKQLEGDLADSEKQRLSDYESGVSRLGLLTEEIQSLRNEASSKEVKIAALQKDLDEAQHRLTEQDLLTKSLKSQLEREEQEREALAGRLQEGERKAEELSENLASKGREAVRLEGLLSESSAEIERLQREVAEREERMEEVSRGMSDRMVQLNEEKFMLGKEVRSLTEKLSLCMQEKLTRDQGVGTEGEEEEVKGGEEEELPKQQAEERAPSASQEVEVLRKENELVRKKLQAALVSRKELLGKVRKLERELEEMKEVPAKPGGKSSAIQENKGDEEPPEGSRNAERDAPPSRRGRAASLGQLATTKGAELQAVLEEKESEMAALRAAVAELQESLRKKDLLVGALQAELEDCNSAPKKETSVGQSAEGAGTADPPAPGIGGPAAPPGWQEGEPKASLEEKICALEQERDQLQKKLQEALASRKDTLKKAQEKDRHHREQLKQQKDDYSILREQFEQQGREMESLRDQLQALSKALEDSAPHESEPSSGVIREPGWEVSGEGRDVVGRHHLAAEDSAVEQLKVKLEQLRAEKRELEARVCPLEGELVSKSELTLQLQEEARHLLVEAEAVKAACREAEASAEHLRLELEESRAEAARQERLRLEQADFELKKALASKEEIDALNSQLAERQKSLCQLEAELQEKKDAIQALQGQLERQSEEQAQRLQVELAEAQQKSSEEAAEEQFKAQLQRKLQAALISRKDALKESKSLREELGSTKAALESASLRLSGAENRAAELEKEKAALLEKLGALGEEREKLIAEVDKALVENQNLSGSCESLKLALEGLTQEKMRLEEEVGSQQRSHAHELSEWQEKHRELQKEYETLLRSYENVSDEADRIQRVVEGVRQEKQEIFLKLKDAEAEKREVEARLQGAEQEVEGMREKMRKFAKSKQHKILELEEENERLRAEVHPLDRDQGKMEDSSALLRKELESSKQTCDSLSSQLKMLMAEKDTLNQQIQDLQSEVEATRKTSKQEEALAASEMVSSSMMVPLEATTAPQAPSDAASTPPEPNSVNCEAGPSCDEINGYIQQIAQLEEQVAELEEKKRVGSEELSSVLKDWETLGEEKKSLEGLLLVKGQELEALREKVAEMEQASQETEERLAGAFKLKEALIAEKDDLEERLMNQLAELNGSIGNYQQEMVDLQSKNQLLQSEVEGLRETLSHLEEEKRHLLTEKAQAEADKREKVEKLKGAWKADGDRTQVKELQELLKEKQQEVRQLQKDCIKNQEKISSLEKTIKALEFVHSESQKELEATRKSLAQAEEVTRKAQAELASSKVLLDDTQSEAARILAESLKVKEDLRVSKAEAKAQLRQKEEEMERWLEEEKSKHLKEISNVEERLARSEGEARDLQGSLRRKDKEAQQLQGNLNHTLAQLAAFTRSMSSLQDDRDRVIDESRQWEKKFSEAIEKKEQEVRTREEACAALEERAKQAVAQVEDLQSRLASLEHSKLAQEASAQKELQRHQEEAESLQEEKGRLVSELEESQKLLSSSQSQAQKQEAELRSLSEQLSHLQDSLAKCEEAREQMAKTVKSQETDLQESRFRQEQLEADLQASKDLTERLQEEMSSKDQKIISLLSAKEEAISAAVSELQQLHKELLKELEERIDKVEEEKVALETEKRKVLEKVDHLTEKLKSAREESRQHKAQLDAFTKSMSSLQDDRDLILADYRQLEQRHLAAILEKDQLIQEAAAENNTLKEELRSLHCQVDDLHAENAKLEAELVRYRQDLNEVISIKDCQQKQLLKTQLDRIQALEKEKGGVEGQLKESEHALANLRLSLEALQVEKREVEASLSQLQSEMAALHEGGPMLELQAHLQGKEEEVLKLSGQLSLAQQRAVELEEELTLLRQTTDEKLHEAEAKMKKELKSLHHDAGLMRNETETAEERVAELAKDLLVMEQRLFAVTEENQDLKAQIQSFKKAMSSLQDSWDQSNEELRAVEKKYSAELEEHWLLVQNLREEKAQSQEEMKDLAEERDRLASELAGLQESTEEKGLLARLEKLNQQLQAKDRELLRLASELEGASAQVKSFSKAMASLQGERDRLLSELDRARKVEEVKLQSDASTSASLAEVPSLKKALSALQNDRDRLLAELKNLQQQYLQVGVDTAEIMRLKAQLQEQERDTEQLKEKSASWQRELQQLREEKTAWELEVTSLREQQLVPLTRAEQETARTGARVVEEQHQRQAPPEIAGSRQTSAGDGSGPGGDTNDLQAQLKSSLKELHQKELRIQQLNSKLSQVFEEKNALSLQLRGSSHNLRESQQRYSEVFARCEALEKQLQEVPPSPKARESLLTDAAPGAPQEKSEHPRESYTPELQELQMRLSEAKQQQSNARQGLLQLEELLQEERDRRLAAEEAFATAQDHIRRLESAEWAHSPDTSIDIPPSPEHALLVGSPQGSFSKTRGGTGLRRALKSLFCSRRRLPLLASIYLLAVHVLLILCFTGHL